MRLSTRDPSRRSPRSRRAARWGILKQMFTARAAAPLLIVSLAGLPSALACPITDSTTTTLITGTSDDGEASSGGSESAASSTSAGGPGCSAPSSVCGPSYGTVKRVIDGDTIELTNGLRIRYLNINAPESGQDSLECFGLEAKDFNTAWVEGEQVCLHYDDVECADKYDRLLAYVETAEGEVNIEMVEQGFACAKYVGPSGEDRKAEFEAVETLARNSKLGLWEMCDPSVCDF